MFYILVLCGALLAAGYAYRRLQRGAYLFPAVMDAPPAVRAAAKRLGFTARPNVHSIVSIHTPEICVAAMAAAFARMDGSGSVDESTLEASLQRQLQVTASEARDMTVLGPWLVAEGGGPTPAFQHMTKRLKQLDHGPFFDKLMRVLGDVAAAGSKGMPSARQADAMGALARIFRTA